MNINLGREVELMGDELNQIESYLAAHMLLVEPRPELIARLRTRMVKTAPEVTVEIKPAPLPAWLELKYVLFGAAGIVSSILLIVTGVKSIQGLRKLRAVRASTTTMTNPA
jgi:hypothetical protein